MRSQPCRRRTALSVASTGEPISVLCCQFIFAAIFIVWWLLDTVCDVSSNIGLQQKKSLSSKLLNMTYLPIVSIFNTFSVSQGGTVNF